MRLLLLLCVFLVSGCVPLREFLKGPGDLFSEAALHTDDTFIRLTEGRKSSDLAQGYRNFSVVLPRQVDLLPEEIASLRVSLDVKAATLRDIAVALSFQLPGIIVDVQIEDPLRAAKLHTLSYTGSLENLLSHLADMNDVWIRLQGRTIIIRDSLPVEISLPVFLDAFKGEVKGDPLTTEFRATPLRDLLLSASQNLGVKVNVVSESSGYVQVEGTPSAVRRFAAFVEKEVRELSRYISIQISIFQLTLNRQYRRELSFFKVADLIWNLQGTLQIGSITTDAASDMSIAVASEKKTLRVLFNYLNTLGDVRILASPVLVVGNGIPAQFEITREIGWWEPGDVEELYGIAGAQTYRYKQGKPSWKDRKVGLSIVARPKIVVEHDREAVHLDLLLRDSDVYGYSRTTWQSVEGIAPIILEKPLISEKKLLNRSVIRKGEYLIIAGLQGRKHDDTSGLHGVTKKVNKEESYLFIVMSAEF